MAERHFDSREGGRYHTDPSSSSRFNANMKFHRRGGIRTITQRPVPNRPGTSGQSGESITVSVHRTLSGGSTRTLGTSGLRGRPYQPKQIHPGPSGQDSANANQEKWWRVSILQAGSIGKERVMSTLKAHCMRQFQAYHYFIDRDTNTGVFFVNSREEAEMLRRANRKVEVQNSGPLSIMVSQASSPAPILDEDARRYFKDFITNHRYNPHTFQLNLANLADDEELRSLGIYPQLNKPAFVRELVDIINNHFRSTRQLDLGTNNISNLYEFRKLQLNDLEQLSLASNDLKSVEELNHLKQLSRLMHLFLKNNPLTSPNNKRIGSRDDLISAIRQRLPQLRRLDETDLPAEIGFGIDREAVVLPASRPYCVPDAMQAFLDKFIRHFYDLFDVAGRDGLHVCYYDPCMLSVCISPTEGSVVATKPVKYGALIHESRNLKKIFDENKRARLLLHGKTHVLDFLRIKFPATKHDGSSFHVDVVSTNNNRAVFSILGLYREVDQRPNGPLRSFQRTFTCAETPAGVLIVADHLMITNITEAQFQIVTRSAPPGGNAADSASSQTMESQSGASGSTAGQDQMIMQFSRESGMNYHFSKQCLADNNWDYQKAAARFLELKNQNVIPPEAFK